jgi:hypothetical protein
MMPAPADVLQGMASAACPVCSSTDIFHCWIKANPARLTSWHDTRVSNVLAAIERNQ